MSTFKELGVTHALVKAITELGFETPMPIQQKVIPMLIQSSMDLIGLAQTGTGKTAAFGLPMIQRIDPDNPKPQGLILAPTRELCLQITKDLKSYAAYIKGIQILSIYGGADIIRQMQALKDRAQIIVATPGRMNDLLNNRKKIDLSDLKTVVLDEADEMLSMGFKEELDAILDKTPPDRNTWLFSATMPKEVQNISAAYMKSPVEVAVGEKNSGAELVEHISYIVRSKDRYLALKRIVDYHPDIYGIIFCRTRNETMEVSKKLIEDGYNADVLNGDLSQSVRESIMHKFRIKNLQMLVATDVAARGLDVKDLTHIINYNLPDECETYIHRSGRTGRAGKKGISIAIFNMKEKYKIKKIESAIKKKFKEHPVPCGKDICKRQVLCLIDKLQRIEVDYKAIDDFLPEVFEKLQWMSREELIKHIVSLEFNRFLEYYRDSDDLVPPSLESEKNEKRKSQSDRRPKKQTSEKPLADRRPEKQPSKKPPSDRQPEKRTSKKSPSDRQPEKHTPETGFMRFYINLGIRDGITPLDMIGLIKRCTRKNSIEVGKIDLMKKFSFFEIDHQDGKKIIPAFKGVEYNQKEVVVETATLEDRPEKDMNGKDRNSKKKKKKKLAKVSN